MLPSKVLALNRGSFFVKLKNWDERPGKEQTAEKVIEKLNRQFSLNQDATITAFNLPPIQGFSATGGVEQELQDQSGERNY